MKKLNLLFVIIVAVFLVCCTREKYRTKHSKDANGYSYEYVTNDPLNTRIYTLDNGLKVYLSVNKDEPRIQTFIAVKAGSTFDPPETTGLAHYLEHMMFKGTGKIGAVDWEKEKVILDQLSDLFEQHKNAKTDKEKKLIYAKIDSLSTIVARYAVPSEYDKLVSSLGANGTNAYTSDESTVYVNDIPSNELEKWLKLESERFSQLVLRLFHTELEAVYEEFNRAQDNDNRKANYALMGSLFKKHPYGTQTTLGKPEHLKNPSMVNIHNYWGNYYVPNNMAICMSGDLNYEETIKLIDKYFGKLKPNSNVPKFVSPVEDSIKEPVIKDVYGPSSEFLSLAYRFNGKNTEDEKYVTLIDMILNNSQAGLIDLDLVQKQKVLSAGSYPDFMINYGIHVFSGKHREGQTLEQVKDLLLGEIEKVKKGEFEGWLLEAIINNMRLNEIRSQEGNYRVGDFVDAFTHSIPWADKLKFIDNLEKITKEQVVKFANEHYKNNYVVVYKRTGIDTNVVKVEKPKITPVDINRDIQSEFYKDFVKQESKNIEPVFVDFKKEIEQKKLKSGIELNYIENKTNELFEISYIIDMGKNHNLKLPLAVNYLPYLGTDKYTPAQLQQELFKLGLSMSVYTGDDRSYITLSGLGKSFEKGVELLEHVLANAKSDKKAYEDYIDGILKKRTDAKLSKETILWGGLLNYGKYGKFSSFTNIIQTDELKSIDPKELTDIIRDIYNYKHKIFYYGQNDINKAKSVIEKYHKVPAELKPYPEPVVYVEQPMDNNKVYFVNYDMVQSNIVMLSKDQLFDKTLLPYADMFNEYYGSGTSSIVFQEIRESKALAYAAYASYSVPYKMDKSNYVYAFTGTQPDKIEIATKTMLGFMNNLLKAQKSFDQSRESIIKRIQTERIIKDDIFWTYQRNMDRGIDYDIRKDIYEKTKGMSMDEFEKFFNAHVKDKKYTFLITGNKKDIDFSVLKKIGDVKEFTLEEIFNY